MFASRWFWRINSLVLLVALLFIWQLYATVYANAQLFPTPLQVFHTFVQMYSEGIIVTSIIDSLYRFVVGFLCGAICAIILGLLLGRFHNMEILLEPMLQILRPISPIAWSPLVLLWLNIGDIPAMFIIFYAVFFPMLALCIAGVRSINKDFIKMASNFGASQYRIFIHIVLPGTFLHISSGLKLAACVAWIHLVAGEMMGSQSGLGFLIYDGKNLLDTSMVIVSMILIGLLGYAIYGIFVLIEKCMLKALGGQL